MTWCLQLPIDYSLVFALLLAFAIDILKKIYGTLSNFCSFIFIFYLPYLSSIHEKANCIAICWTERPRALGSCHFRGVWAICLPHKCGGVQLSALPKDITSKLAGLFSATSPKCRAPSREAVETIFHVFWYDSTKGLNPRSTDCEANALITTPSRRFDINFPRKSLHFE